MNAIKQRLILDSENIKIPELKEFIGNEVEIIIKKIKSQKSKQKIWRHNGSVNLGSRLDNINIREFLYE
jgi:hypothetical protein